MGSAVVFPYDKAYVDSQDNKRVLKAGDTMTGNLAVNRPTATAQIDIISDVFTLSLFNDSFVAGFGDSGFNFDGDEFHIISAGITVTDQDFYAPVGGTGFVLRDRTTGLYRRIKCTAGVLATEAA